MPVCFMPHMHIVVWKSQIGAKTLVNLGTGKKLTCFDPLRKGCRIFFNFFFDNYWSSTLHLQHSTHKKIILMKYFCFKILQCSPYHCCCSRRSCHSCHSCCSCCSCPSCRSCCSFCRRRHHYCCHCHCRHNCRSCCCHRRRRHHH